MFGIKSNNDEILRIAREALELAKQQPQKEEKVICRLTTTSTYNDDSPSYLKRLSEFSDSEMLKFYTAFKREQIISWLSRTDAADDQVKLRYMHWLEGIDWFLEGLRAAETRTKGEGDEEGTL